MTLTVDEYASRFHEEPGFLDFAAFGPVGDTVVAEQNALTALLTASRHGALAHFLEQEERVKQAVAGVTGFRADQVAFQPSTSYGLMHTLFGLTGGVALSAAEFPAITFAAVRAQQALGVVTPVWLEPEHGRVTPGELRDALDPSVVAVAVSLVDFRTGALADLDGIRQVIGDRLLIVDATQGLGVVDAHWEAADVIAAGGQKWPRAGWGTGFLALSDRALEHLTPVWSGFTGVEGEMPLDGVIDPAPDARAYGVSHGDPIAAGRFAAALEEIAEVGVPDIAARISERVDELIDLVDEFQLPIVSPRAEAERAGIVVVEPEGERLTALLAALHNHGISATSRVGTVRFSVHASTGDDTLALLRQALVAFASGL